MKIVVLTERMKLGFGVDLVVDQQASRLARLGHQVTVVVVRADMDLPALDYELVVLNRVVSGPRFDSEAEMKRIFAQARIGAPDVWMVHAPPFYDWIPWLEGPVVAVEYGTPPGALFRPEIGNTLDAIADKRIRKTYQQLGPNGAIVSISHSIHRWLPPDAQRRSTVIHLGADHLPRARQQDVFDLRKEYGLGDGCLVLWIGRMQLRDDEQPYKGFPELLRLMHRAEVQALPARFLLAGRVSTSDEAELRSRGMLVRANVPSDELATLYAAADVLLNLSKWEGFNLALVEAEYQGTPVVAYDFGPHPEIVQSDHTGLLAKTDNGLVQSLERLTTDRAKREQLGRQARVFAQRFSWDANVAQLVTLMERLVAAAQARGGSAPAPDAADTPVLASAPTPPDTADATQPASSGQAGFRLPALLRSGRAGPKSWSGVRDADFADKAFRALLGRPVEPAMVDAVSRQLTQGRSRLSVLIEIRDSEEGSGRPLADAELAELLGSQAAQKLRQSDEWLVAERLQLLLPEARAARASASAALSGVQSLSSKLDAELARVHAAVTQVQAQTASHPSTAAPAVRAVVYPGSRIGRNHVLVLAPGTKLEPRAMEWLTAAAASSASDIVFGDERARPDGRPAGVGPFSEEVFSAVPDLGGVLAVRRSLLRRAGLPGDVALDRDATVRLAECATTLSYVPRLLAERSGGRPAPAADSVSDSTAHRLDGGVDKVAFVLVEEPGQDAGYEGLEAWARREGHHAVRVTARSSLGDPAGASYGRQVNAAVQEAPEDCSVVIVADATLRPETPDWLHRLCRTVSRSRVGVLSPRTLFQDGRIRHAGLAFGLGEPATYIARFEPAESSETGGHPPRTGLLREVSAVARDCLAIRRDVFLSAGGFDEHLCADTADIDLCFRLRSSGYAVLVDGRVSLRSRAGDVARWGRPWPLRDLLLLLERHAPRMLAPDAFHVAPGEVEETEGSGHVRTTVTSWSLDSLTQDPPGGSRASGAMS